MNYEDERREEQLGEMEFGQTPKQQTIKGFFPFFNLLII